MVLRVSFEGNLSVAVSALEVEPENFDSQISFFITYLHSHIKLGSNVEIVSACIAP